MPASHSGRLPDPRLAREHHGARKCFGAVEEPDDRSELLLPADKLTGGDGHVLILGQVAGVVQLLLGLEQDEHKGTSPRPQALAVQPAFP